MPSGPLQGVRAVVIALNVPGPVAAHRLQGLGASVVKYEPLHGDPLATIAPEWYRELHAHIDVRAADLKLDEAQQLLHAELAESDLLITSFRPVSLERLGLDHASLAKRHPALNHVAIVGEAGERANAAGHDLTYVARLGLISPPSMPLTLIADLSGAERAVSTAIALLFAKQRTGMAAYAEVSLASTANEFAAPIRHGLTRSNGALSGKDATYRMYQASDGWIVVAALEAQFAVKLLSELNLTDADADVLSAIFLQHTANYWDAWADAHNLPIAAVRIP